jgi:hypothetical protein
VAVIIARIGLANGVKLREIENEAASAAVARGVAYLAFPESRACCPSSLADRRAAVSDLGTGVGFLRFRVVCCPSPRWSTAPPLPDARRT